MKRILLILFAVLLLIPLILLTWLTATESGLHWTYQQARAYLPAELSMNKLEGRLSGPIIVRGIEYRQDGAVIKAEQILFNWQPLSLLLANIDISRLHIQSLNIVLPKTEKTDQSPVQALDLPDIHLPWRMKLEHGQIDDLSINQDDQTYRLKQIKLAATSLFSKIDIDALSISADTFNLNITGELKPTRNYSHDLDISWQTQLPSSVVIKGNGQLKGNMVKTRIKQQLDAPLQLTLDAEVRDLLRQLNWKTKIDVTRFDTSKLDRHWPALSGKLKLEAKGDLATATVSGKLDAIYADHGPLNAEFKLQRLSNNSLQIDQLKLDAPDDNTHLDVQGQWIPGKQGGDVKLALNWKNLRWPLSSISNNCTMTNNGKKCEPQSPWFNSASGSGTIDGNLDRYHLKLETDRPWPQAPPSHWYASAEGNLDGLNFHSLRITTMDGEALTRGHLNWSPVLSWNASLSATGINPGSLWPQLPGQISASLTSKGRYEKGEWIASADIRQLAGKLRNYPVSLNSKLSLQNHKLDIAKLDFSSGGSQVSLQGQVGDKLKLNWSLTSTDLAELYPQAIGELQAQGQVSGPRDTPLIKASIKGRALKLPDYELGSVEGTIAVDLFKWQQTDIKLTTQAIKLNDYSLQSLDIDANTQHLKVKATSEEVTAQIELRGKLDANGWRGRIERADFQSQRYADWRLKAPTALNIGSKTLVANALCWHNNQQASLCTSLQRTDNLWQIQFKTKKIPLLLLDPWLPPDLKLEGVADASAQLSFQAPDQLLGQIQIELPPGALNYPLLEGERDRWEYRAGKVDISLTNLELKASTEIAMSNGDRFQGWIKLPNAKLLALNSLKQPLEASLKLNIHDLGLFEAIVPEVQELRGEVELNLSVAGTLAQPSLNGLAQLTNGALRIPRLGLTIDQLKLKAQSTGAGKVKVQLNAHSGDGNLEIIGLTTLDRTAGWPTEITIKGDQFEISRIPEARVQISPDLQIKLQHHTININGKVHIPYAKLQPKDITTAAKVSDDVVIVGGEQATEEKWSIVTKIRLTLGDRVNFYGFGFEGRLGGSLLLEDEPGQLTKATGEINIPEGRYRAYGQRLDVEHGRLLYTGGPITNPGLDLRAVRYINNVTAGIKVKGSLNQPQLELFSIPTMGQTDTLSYLLLGRPMENASGEEGAMMAKAALALGLSGGDRIARLLGDQFGLDEMRVESSESGDQASLVVGRYLSPKLYVSYGVGLLEAINTLTVRYQISEKWQLKAESGEAQGADFLYTIER